MENSVEEKKESPEHENEETLNMLVEAFEEFSSNTIESRKEAELDRDYYDGYQWTDEEIKVLEARKQPVVTINRIKPKVDFLLGMERQNRTDPKAFPRTPQHEGASEAATDALRYVADNNEFDQLSSDGFENLLIEGTEAAEIIVEPRGADFEIKVNLYKWDRIWWDIHSRKRDFSDAQIKGVTQWMTLENAKRTYPGKEELLEGAINTTEYDDTFEDTPRATWATGGKSKRVRINLAYYKEDGKWNYAHYTKTGFLKGPEVSTYLDEYGDPDCQFEFQSSYVDRDGYRYGTVRNLRDIQDEINKRRSKSLHLLNSRNVIAEEGAVNDVDDARRALASPDGWVIKNPNFALEIQNMSDLSAGHAALLQEAKSEIDAIGANPLQGKTDNISGRAFIAQQKAGQMELGPVFDSHRAWKRRVYRKIWNRVRQYWTDQKWIRVTDDENNLKFVGLNQPVTLRQQLEQEGEQIPPDMANDPRLNEVVEVQNQVAELDVDIIIEETPDSINIQQEQFETLARLAEVYGPQNVPFEEIVRFSDLRGKEQFLERTKGNEQQKQANAQKQQEIEEIQKQDVVTKIEERIANTEVKKAQTLKTLAEAEKTSVETDLIPYNDQFNQ